MENQSKLPCYAPQACSEKFQLAFSHTGTYSAATCICTRTHFSEQFPLDDQDDIEQIEKLQRLNKEMPDRYISYLDAVSYFTSHGTSIVFECPCNYAGFLETFISEHSNSIMNYFDSVASEQKDKAVAFDKKVQETKKVLG